VIESAFSYRVSADDAVAFQELSQRFTYVSVSQFHPGSDWFVTVRSPGGVSPPGKVPLVDEAIDQDPFHYYQGLP